METVMLKLLNSDAALLSRGFIFEFLLQSFERNNRTKVRNAVWN